MLLTQLTKPFTIEHGILPFHLTLPAYRFFVPDPKGITAAMDKRFHRPGHPHVDVIVNESISQLATYSGLILTIWLVIVFIVRFYIFEGFLMRRIYREKYASMTDEVVRRGFVNHHVAGLIKISLLVTAAYPFISVAFGTATMHSSFDGQDGRVTMGDVLVVCSQLFISMYVFELFYRPKISPVSSLHHIGAIIIAQSAVSISLDFQHEVDATIEFLLCFVWGKCKVHAVCIVASANLGSHAKSSTS